MANENHLKILKQGVEAWNQWRKENPVIRPNLSFADLGLADLRFANLSRADFSETDLSGSSLVGADLSESNFLAARLSATILNRAHLVGTNLNRAQLWGSRLEGADLRGTILSRADLRDTDLRGATVGWITFGGNDLSRMRGLETVQHEGPSYIDIHTVYRSRGKIPKVFLQGAGVPDSMIEFMYSLVRSNRIKDFYSSCFISHSSKDQDFAKRLYADLQDKGVRCWFAPEDMKIGDRIRPTLDVSVRAHDKLLIILSENSVGSDWVEQEVETALARERQEKRTVLFPIRLDDTVMEIEVGWPALIRNTRHIGDFRNWKDHDAYQQAFGRLLRDLKAEYAPS